MTKATKKEVKQDEVEVFGADTVAPTQPDEAPVAKVAGDEFPASIPVKVSEFGVPVFQVVQIGAMARIYGKAGVPVSGVITPVEASRQASRHNAMDPEQQAAKARGKRK